MRKERGALDPTWFRWLMGALLTVGLTALLAGAYVLARHPAAGPGSRECAAAYRRARTAADTAAVERQRPAAQGKFEGGLTCGAQRASGELR